ncbi:hypothetical protein EV655_10674 [Rhodovulum euryhalinum]|uniref:Uncharacterized protein n=1 Tax=Rhodovulum euryhalinum TaxID=35805 RepID=A0A4R2KGP6_9RHOB|nr:hypothetical protein EV655_10674 [Rhodovulum euryhalinum]
MKILKAILRVLTARARCTRCGERLHDGLCPRCHFAASED